MLARSSCRCRATERVQTVRPACCHTDHFNQLLDPGEQQTLGASLRMPLWMQMMKNKDMAYTDAEACLWMSQIAEGLQYLHSSVPKVATASSSPNPADRTIMIRHSEAVFLNPECSL